MSASFPPLSLDATRPVRLFQSAGRATPTLTGRVLPRWANYCYTRLEHTTRHGETMARYVGAIDQGTTSTRFIVFDRGGNMISSAQKEHKQIFPKPGWVEHDPIEIWQNTQEVAGAALARASLGPSDLAAVGITNQRETTVLWNKRSGKPLHNE